MATHENLQEQFLNTARREHMNVTIFLMNGFQLRGVITGYDNYALILISEGKQHMIYKHAISTIIPSVPIRMGDDAL